MPSVKIISSLTLEPWSQNTPWTTGIGGSETSHIEMHQRLKKVDGLQVVSYAPSKYEDCSSDWVSIDDVNKDTAAYVKDPGVYIIYRDPKYFDFRSPRGKQSWWFVAQDVDYDVWTPERLEKVDRYVCLCKEHAHYTEGKYPELKGRIYISSNGIRSDYIRNAVSRGPRNPNKLFFPSSPDRGLKLLLQNWFRIREINPKAELHFAYGFNNMERIVQLNGKEDWRYKYQLELQALAKQDGIKNWGRLPQQAIYDQWATTNIWAHPTDFPETSCITCMEAQALGAWPVTNKLWALEDNVGYGWMVDGIPQKSELVRSQWLHNLEKAFAYDNEKERAEMMGWALQRHDWQNVVKQWINWIEEDTQ